MCGIVGFIGKGDEQTLERMVASLHHRGPDDKGTFFDARNGVGLGHARLSILDLSPAGHQPMWDGEGKVALIFNGEIYNWKELRKEMESVRKFAWRSSSDTEVIINAYKVYGEKCFQKMEGMFALALYDSEKKIIIMARDRAGKKPLYWGVHDRTLIFGSEMKALVLHPSFKKVLDIGSVNKYLQFDFVPTPHTLWQHTWKLAPGTYAVVPINSGGVDVNAVRKEKYWIPSLKTRELTFADAKSELDSLIFQAVNNRLVADVPVGVFLSGGLDSSVVAYYAKQASLSPVKTFSIGFSEKSFDESSYARQVAKYLGTDHHERILNGEDSLSVVEKVLANMDDPNADASIIPTYLLASFARENVTVALGGDGGDELFAGYPTFQAERVARLYTALPKTLRSIILEPIINSLPVSTKNFSLEFKLKKFVEGFRQDGKYRHQVWLGSFTRDERSQLFNVGLWSQLEKGNEYEDIDSILNEVLQYENGLNKILYEYERTYLLDEVLVKVDRATMLASLEARSPLLDFRIVEFAHSLPARYKLRGFKTKYILKELMKGKLPDNIIKRPKKGFGIPLAEWLSGPLRPMLDEVLSEANLKKCGDLFSVKYINRLKEDHYVGRRDNRKKLWNLLVLSRVLNKYNV